MLYTEKPQKAGESKKQRGAKLKPTADPVPEELKETIVTKMGLLGCLFKVTFST